MRALLLSILFILCAMWLRAQDVPVSFTHLNEKDGLSFNTVGCFLKDSQGVLWVGTMNGLNRYDGSHFYIFKKGREKGSLSNAKIISLCEDKKGNIWGSTENGIFRYQKNENRFVNYAVPNAEFSRFVNNLACDKAGNIWATGYYSLLKYDARLDSFITAAVLTTNRDSLVFYNIPRNGMVEDPSGRGLWLATTFGVSFYSFHSSRLEISEDGQDAVFFNWGVSAMAKSKNGSIWYFDNSTQDIVAFDPVNRKILRRISVKEKSAKVKGLLLYEDRNNRLWFGSMGHGAFLIDLKTENITTLTHSEKNPFSISNSLIAAAYQDEDGTVWLGTLAGISKCNPENTVVKLLRMSDRVPLLDTTTIATMAEDRADKSWWMATTSQNLINFEPTSGKYAVYDVGKTTHKKDGVAPGRVLKIKFFEGQVLLCTPNGMWQLNKQTGVIAPVSVLPDQFFYTSDFTSVGDSLFYFTNRKDLLWWNRKTNAVVTYNYTVARLEDGQIPVLHDLVSNEGKSVWTSTAFGWISQFDGKKLSPIKIIDDEELKFSAPMSAMEIDETGRVWMAHESVGLFSYEPKNEGVSYWDESKGLVSDYIQTATPDRSGHIWCLAGNKLSVLNVKTNRFYNFLFAIKENAPINLNKIMLLSDGNLIGSINNELLMFYPSKLDLKPADRKPVISVVNVSGKDILIQDEGPLALQTEQNSLTFRFGTLTDKSVFAYVFKYKLEGFDKDWKEAVGADQAVYNNLKPGDYSFRLIARGKNDEWQSEVRIFNFTIQTPYYQTWWFLLLMILAAVSTIVGIYKYRLAQKTEVMKLQGKAQMLEKEKALVMYESLKQQLNPHFLFNSLTSLSSLIDAEPKAAREFLASLSKTYRYILKSRENESVHLADEIKFAESYVKLQKTRFEHGLIVNIDIPEQFHHRKLVPVTLQNLIENAIKHNIIDVERPLIINVFVEGEDLMVKNNLQKKNFVETSNRQGLANMQSLYQYLSTRPVEITETPTEFIVRIPLI